MGCGVSRDSGAIDFGILSAGRRRINLRNSLCVSRFLGGQVRNAAITHWIAFQKHTVICANPTAAFP